MSTSDDKVRLDKWLWAARFFKTRSLAKSAIDAGQIRYNDKTTKPGHQVRVGAMILIKKDQVRRTVLVQAISGKRRGAPEASLLYEETPESVAEREAEALIRSESYRQGNHRPNKQERRSLQKFKRQQ